MPNGGAVKLGYDPKRRPYNSGAVHLSYNVPNSLSRNPVTNTLKNKKRQLRQSGWDGLAGVILCDGDCNMLTTRMNSGSALTLEQIVRDFLRQNRSIDFVLTIGIQTHHNHLSVPRETLDVQPRLLAQPALGRESVDALVDVFNRAIADFPPLERNAANALRLASSTRPLHANRKTFYGGWHFTMGKPTQTTEIKISARALAAVLGGELDFETFRKGQQIRSNVNDRVFDFFQTMVREGRTIIEAKIEPRPAEDDDVVLLRFGLPDAAASKFRVPGEIR
ncbi:MAG: hypothetical protein EXS37_08735 [Opitutus sp.]|nr:hypothetical protein [Opitutus sp.]